MSKSAINKNVYKLKVIVLAAGKSERFGDIKVLAKVLAKKKTTSKIPYSA